MVMAVGRALMLVDDLDTTVIFRSVGLCGDAPGFGLRMGGFNPIAIKEIYRFPRAIRHGGKPDRFLFWDFVRRKKVLPKSLCNRLPRVGCL